MQPGIGQIIHIPGIRVYHRNSEGLNTAERWLRGLRGWLRVVEIKAAQSRLLSANQKSGVNVIPCNDHWHQMYRTTVNETRNDKSYTPSHTAVMFFDLHADGL